MLTRPDVVEVCYKVRDAIRCDHAIMRCGAMQCDATRWAATCHDSRAQKVTSNNVSAAHTTTDCLIPRCRAPLYTRMEPDCPHDAASAPGVSPGPLSPWRVGLLGESIAWLSLADQETVLKETKYHTLSRTKCTTTPSDQTKYNQSSTRR